MFFLLVIFSYINDDWQPHNSNKAFYADLKGPGDFRYYYGQPVNEHKCSFWLYTNQGD